MTPLALLWGYATGIAWHTPFPHPSLNPFPQADWVTTRETFNSVVITELDSVIQWMLLDEKNSWIPELNSGMTLKWSLFVVMTQSEGRD